MNGTRLTRQGLVALVVCLAGCSSAAPPPSAATTPSMPSASASAAPSASPAIRDVMTIAHFAPLEPGLYFIDPDGDASTSLRVVYRVPGNGWLQWIGAAKLAESGGGCSSSGCPAHPSHVGVSITTVTNLVTDGCRDHSWADPPVGGSVDDLVAALSDLAPFRVTVPPTDVAIDGFSGKHLEWTVPDLPVEGSGADQRFVGCIDGNLKSWVAFIDTAEPGDAFYGYTGPGYVEEFWIVDVQGTRLLIAAGRAAGSPASNIAEQRAIIDSIRIEP